MMKRAIWTSLFAAWISVITGCSETAEPSTLGVSTPESRPAAPLVKANRTDLLYSWFQDGEAKSSRKIDEIPTEWRTSVRVQSLSQAPEHRNPNWVFIANLTAPAADGTFPVLTIPREQYELQRHPSNKDAAADKATPDRAAPKSDSASPPVIMYATTHCPYCHKARKWLLAEKIPYREIDIEKDEAAADLLGKKGRQQGIRTGGVPMFEIRGQLIPGFDPEAIRKALRGDTGAAPPSAAKPPSAAVTI